MSRRLEAPDLFGEFARYKKNIYDLLSMDTFYLNSIHSNWTKLLLYMRYCFERSLFIITINRLLVNFWVMREGTSSIGNRETSPLSKMATKNIANESPLSTMDRSSMAITIGNRWWMPLATNNGVFKWRHAFTNRHSTPMLSLATLASMTPMITLGLNVDF